ncbi:MAG: hypothetical protein L3J12_08865, partial [Spirochaetales bacterium]|nr:hypothetical protein [Spirochaetales bacterium]
FISRGLLSVLNTSAEFLEVGNFLKLVTFYEYEQEQGEDLISFLSGSKGITKYIDILEPYINGSRRGLVYFYGRKSYGLSWLSFSIAGLLQGKTMNAPWLYIKYNNSLISSIS